MRATRALNSASCCCKSLIRLLFASISRCDLTRFALPVEIREAQKPAENRRFFAFFSLQRSGEFPIIRIKRERTKRVRPRCTRGKQRSQQRDVKAKITQSH